jgi:peptidoglycan/xylan/chitin deacetylase (PgdA/CDA1 family)
MLRLLPGAAASALVGGPASAADGGVPVLVYHRFDPRIPGPTTVRTSSFESQIAALRRSGRGVVPLHDAVAGLGKVPAARAAIAVDDGHASVHSQLFPILRALGAPVTLFIYPSAISNAAYALTWAQLREMQASGLVDVQSHTYWHPNFNTERRRRSEKDYLAFADDQLVRSKSVVEARLDKPVDMLAWPFGIVDAQLEAAAKRAGYAAAFAYEGGPMSPGDDPFALPRIPITDGDRGERLESLLRTRNRKPVSA